PAPDFSLPGADGKVRLLAGLRGHPALLVFWSPSSAASVAVLRDLAGQQATMAQAGAGMLAVALDTPLDGAKARAVAATVAGLPVALGNDEVGGIYAL